jgi:hypothetical protein
MTEPTHSPRPHTLAAVRRLSLAAIGFAQSRAQLMARSTSSIKSFASSMPMERRTKPSPMPRARRVSGGTARWLDMAG